LILKLFYFYLLSHAIYKNIKDIYIYYFRKRKEKMGNHCCTSDKNIETMETRMGDKIKRPKAP